MGSVVYVCFRKGSLLVCECVCAISLHLFYVFFFALDAINFLSLATQPGRQNLRAEKPFYDTVEYHYSEKRRERGKR